MMKTTRLLIPALLSALMLAACNHDNTATTVDKIKADVAKDIETDMNKAIEEAKSDMTDITINLKDGGKASIAANGDLEINGTAIVLNDNQRALTTAYYAATKKIAMQGIEIGKESAKLATQAIGVAISSVFGDTDGTNGKDIDKTVETKVGEIEDIEKSIEAKAGNIEAAAMKLCESAMELKAIQENLAVAVPQFTPEPMTVDRQDDGCNVHSGSEPPEPPQLPEPPPAPPEPPAAPSK